ncbi:MAG: MFS transporter [Comamonadaceae bacterium]|nr:MAG: MFS transporter [Comamonadaceae bacterium]
MPPADWRCCRDRATHSRTRLARWRRWKAATASASCGSICQRERRHHRIDPVTTPTNAWFPALEEPQVRRYLLGQGTSILGTWMLDITLNLLVWQLTRAPAMLGVLNFLIYGPALFVTPLVSPRLHAGNARRVTLWVLVAALVVAVALTAAAALDWLTLPVLFLAAAARGVLGGMEVPSRQMLLVNISPDDSRLGSAIAMNTVVFLLARTAGPGLAALMFEPLGPGCAFALAAGGLLFMLHCVVRLRVRSHDHPSARGQPAPTGLRGAWEFVRQDRFGSLFLPVAAAVGLCVGAYQTLVPVLADRTFGDANRWTGWFFAAAGGGALVAALLLSSRYLDTLLRRFLLLVPWSGVVALSVLAVSSHVAATLAAFAVLGFCTSFVGTGTNATLHRRAPPEARGGLIALFLLAFVGVMPFAQLLSGLLAQWLPLGATFAVLAVLLCTALTALYGARWRRQGSLELDLATSEGKHS